MWALSNLLSYLISVTQSRKGRRNTWEYPLKKNVAVLISYCQNKNACLHINYLKNKRCVDATWVANQGRLRVGSLLNFDYVPYEPKSQLGVIYSRMGSYRQNSRSAHSGLFHMCLILLGSADQPGHALLIVTAKAQETTQNHGGFFRFRNEAGDGY